MILLALTDEEWLVTLIDLEELTDDHALLLLHLDQRFHLLSEKRANLLYHLKFIN